MSKKTKIVLALVAAFVLVAAVAWAFMGGDESAAVETATVSSESLSSTVVATGEIKPAERIEVTVPTAGTLAEVLVSDGDTVEVGQIIARMDTLALEAQVAQARSGVAQAKAALDGLSTAVTKEDLTAAQAGRDVAARAYDAAVASRDAVAAGKAAKEAVFASDPTTTTPVESVHPNSADLAAAQSGVDQAYLALKNAEAGLARAKNPASAASRNAAVAAYDTATTALALAEDTLAKAELKAPVSGVVFFEAIGQPGADGTLPKARAGSVVSPAVAPFSVIDMNGLVFKADVDEADVSLVEADMSALVVLDSFGDREFAGTVVSVAKQASTTLTGGTVFSVTVSLKPTDDELLLGMKGDVTIEVETRTAEVAIPIEALFEQGREQYVFMVVDGILEKTPIETGTITETFVEVIDGLDEGDEVALAGAFDYVDGMSVGGSAFPMFGSR